MKSTLNGASWLLFSFIFAFLANSLAGAAPTGSPLVEARLAHFYKALVDRVGQSIAHEYLEGWTEAEIVFFEKKVNHLLAAMSHEQKAVPSTDQLFMKHSSDAFGMLGEVYANVKSKARIKPPVTFLDEIAYGELNRRGNKPDGLAYEIRGEKFILHFVTESKAGLNGYDRNQMEGVLDTWKKSGITLLVDGAVKTYSSKDIEISLPIPGGFEIKPLVAVTNAECEPAVFLVATRDHPHFKGEMQKLPIKASVLRDIIFDYIEISREGRPTILLKENFRVPEFPDAESLEAYRTQLRDWIGEFRVFPKSGSASHLEKYLAHQISKRGGQAKAFINDLDDASRHYLATLALDKRLRNDGDYLPLPARNQLEYKLLAGLPTDPGMVSTLRAYFRGYERNRTVQAEGIDAHPLIVALKKKPEWAEYFSKNAPRDLLHANIDDVTRCLDWLADLGK